MVGTLSTSYGDEVVLDCGGRKLRGISADHIRAIEAQKAELEAANKTIALQADEIASLKRQSQLEAKLDAMNLAIQRLQQDQVLRLLAVTGKQDELVKEMDSVKGGLPKKSFLDSLPVRFAFTALGGAANARDLFRSYPSCK